jgi:short-subunit dehydrogenase
MTVHARGLSGRHAVVTGASRGIGQQIARELAARGARVTVVARTGQDLHTLASEIGGNACPADLTDTAAVDGLIDRIEAAAGPVDMLFNNAALAVVGRVADQSAAGIRDSFALNCVAPVELCRQVLPGMQARGYGRIANVSSLAGITAFPTLSTYGATKAALVQFSAVLQRELRRSAVTVTIVQLGEVAGTDMMEQARQSPTIAAVSRRLARVRAMPTLSPQYVARAMVEATVEGRRGCVVPRRFASFHGIRELPSRMNDVVLLGID